MPVDQTDAMFVHTALKTLTPYSFEMWTEGGKSAADDVEARSVNKEICRLMTLLRDLTEIKDATRFMTWIDDVGGLGVSTPTLRPIPTRFDIARAEVPSRNGAIRVAGASVVRDYLKGLSLPFLNVQGESCHPISSRALLTLSARLHVKRA